MAKNMRRAFDVEKAFHAVVTHPTTPASGDPCRVGQTPCVALTNEGAGGNLATETSLAKDGDWDMSVKGIDGSGNIAVADGDILYYTDADTPPLSKKATGVRWGYARAAVTSGATATITVTCGY